MSARSSSSSPDSDRSNRIAVLTPPTEGEPKRMSGINGDRRVAAIVGAPLLSDSVGPRDPVVGGLSCRQVHVLTTHWCDESEVSSSMGLFLASTTSLRSAT